MVTKWVLCSKRNYAFVLILLAAFSIAGDPTFLQGKRNLKSNRILAMMYGLIQIRQRTAPKVMIVSSRISNQDILVSIESKGIDDRVIYKKSLPSNLKPLDFSGLSNNPFTRAAAALSSLQSGFIDDGNDLLNSVSIEERRDTEPGNNIVILKSKTANNWFTTYVTVNKGLQYSRVMHVH